MVVEEYAIGKEKYYCMGMEEWNRKGMTGTGLEGTGRMGSAFYKMDL